MRLFTAVALLAAAATLPAQEVNVFSELRRTGPTGEVVEPDRTGTPREIISPAVGRNGFASFHIVVTVPTGKRFTLHIGDNPENSFQYTLYKEVFGKEGSLWIPDRLEKVDLPFSAIVPESTAILPDQTSMSFWLDAWIPDQTPIRRIRVEAQLNVDDRWVIYPMEFRVQPATFPHSVAVKGALPPVTASSAESAYGAVRAWYCSANEKPVTTGLTVRDLIRRNASQDMALAKALEPSLGAENVQKSLYQALGISDPKQWCGSHTAPGDPEMYLKVRDLLFKLAIH